MIIFDIMLPILTTQYLLDIIIENLDGVELMGLEWVANLYDEMYWVHTNFFSFC